MSLLQALNLHSYLVEMSLLQALNFTQFERDIAFTSSLFTQFERDIAFTSSLAHVKIEF